MTLSGWGSRSPSLAAFLSLLFPGLGQYAAGDRRRGVLIAIPALVVLTGLIGVVIGTVLGGGPSAVIGLVLSPEVLRRHRRRSTSSWLAYHVFAILDAWLVARRARTDAGRRTSRFAIVGLLAVIAVATLGHGTVAALGMETEDTLTAVFRATTRPQTPTATGRSPRRASRPTTESRRRPSRPRPPTPAPGVAGVPPSLVPTLAPDPDAAARSRTGPRTAA